MRTHLMFAILVGLLVAASSCNSPSKTPSGQASYRLKCGPKVPPEIARTIESKTYYEGRNELISSPTSRLYAVIAQGELDSMILEVDGEKPTVVARMPDPPPNPTDETPMGCDQKLDLCLAGCSSAPDPECCRCRCLLNWIICRRSGPGGGSLGISIY